MQKILTFFQQKTTVFVPIDVYNFKEMLTTALISNSLKLLSHLSKFPFEFSGKIPENDMIGQEKLIPYKCLHNVLISLQIFICFVNIITAFKRNANKCHCESYKLVANEMTIQRMHS